MPPAVNRNNSSATKSVPAPKASAESFSAAHISTKSNAVLAFFIVMVLATLLIRMPPVIMDMLLALSLSLSISILIITLCSKESLELSTFPSLLLFTTLFRLSLNVSSTRLILMDGNAGRIIESFGNFVAGGSLIIGLVIFLILVIIQFVVITKGAERISEVSARFTLDAMPGKQMAIDADLNAGLITETQANERRQKIVKESEFYGAMDGASKFIRGDAKAGLIITAINLLGGIILGYTRGMNIADATKIYSILSIGDGLVNQIPSIIISVSSGFLVTKISSHYSIGHDFSVQFFRSSQPLRIASTVMAAMAFVPGLPALPFLLLAGGTFMISNTVLKNEKNAAAAKEKTPVPQAKADKEPVENLLEVDRISVHVGVRLISLVDPRKNGTIFERIGAMRRKFAQQFGIIIPLVRLKDNIQIEPNSYEIRIYDLPVARGRLEPEMCLAMDSGNVRGKIDGIKTTEPVFGLPALWISPGYKENAELNGYTVIDSESVFITHLSETLKKHADELLTREDVQSLIERLRASQPSLVGEVIGELVPIGLLQRILRNLLASGVPIRELTTILEALGENTSKTKNTAVLTELVRKSLARTITELFKDNNNKVTAITLDPVLEHKMASSVKQESDSINISMPIDTMVEINKKIADAWKKAMDKGLDRVVMLCDSRLRSPLSGMLARSVPMLPVAAYDEIVLGTEIEPIDTISAQVNELSDSTKKETSLVR